MKFLAAIALLLSLTYVVPSMACDDKNKDDKDQNPQEQSS